MIDSVAKVNSELDGHCYEKESFKVSLSPIKNNCQQNMLYEI